MNIDKDTPIPNMGNQTIDELAQRIMSRAVPLSEPIPAKDKAWVICALINLYCCGYYNGKKESKD